MVILHRVSSVVNNSILQMKKLWLEEVSYWSQAIIRCQRNVCTIQVWLTASDLDILWHITHMVWNTLTLELALDLNLSCLTFSSLSISLNHVETQVLNLRSHDSYAYLKELLWGLNEIMYIRPLIHSNLIIAFNFLLSCMVFFSHSVLYNNYDFS